MTESESGVVEAKLVEQGGMDIMDCQGIDDGAIAKLVSFAISRTPFEPPTSHEEGEAIDVVITPAVCGDGGCVGGSSHFTSP